MVDNCREIKYTSGMSYNKEVTREKSVKKEARYKQTYKRLKIKHKKIKPI